MPYDIGEAVVVDGKFTDDANEPADPSSLKLFTLFPDAEEVEFVYDEDDSPIVRESAGVYSATFYPAASGAHSYRWEAFDADANPLTAEPGVFPVRGRYLVPWYPQIDQVATELHARTRDDSVVIGGQPAGRFTATTRTTRQQAALIAHNAYSDVVREVGKEVPEELVDDARRVAELRTAALIERSYIPELTEGAASTIYQTLRIEYEEAVKKLADNMAATIAIEQGFL